MVLLMSASEGGNLVLSALRLLHDYAEARHARAERVAAARLADRVDQLERQVTALRKRRRTSSADQDPIG